MFSEAKVSSVCRAIYADRVGNKDRGRRNLVNCGSSGLTGYKCCSKLPGEIDNDNPNCAVAVLRFGLPFVLYMERTVTWDALQKEILEKMRHLLRPGVYIQVFRYLIVTY